jgi:zinc protease
MLFYLIGTAVLSSILLIGTPSIAEEEPSPAHQLAKSFIAQEKHLSSIDVDEIILSNGMRVLIRQMESDEDDVYIRLTAKGGYSILPTNQRASGQLASEIGWESGLGELSTDQLTVLLYENSVEYNPEIQPFSRFIEGSCDSHGVEAFLQLVNMTFTKQKFTREAFERVIKQTRESIKKSTGNSLNNFEEAFKRLNSQNASILNQLTEPDLLTVDFASSKEFYQRCFENPGDFVCVIVGNFERKRLDSWLSKYLGSIPRQHTLKPFTAPDKLPFPSGITQKTAVNQQRSECLTRITFPVSLQISESNIRLFEFTTQVIETRLKTVLRNHLDETLGLDVAYEFPLYPYFENIWLILQFRCGNNRSDAIKDMILKNLEILMTNGPLEEELNQAKNQLRETQEFWEKQPAYWIATLSNYALWNWNLSGISHGFEEEQKHSPQNIKELLKTILPLKNFTVLSTKTSL